MPARHETTALADISEITLTPCPSSSRPCGGQTDSKKPAGHPGEVIRNELDNDRDAWRSQADRLRQLVGRAGSLAQG
jgi:hypothetical protein